MYLPKYFVGELFIKTKLWQNVKFNTSSQLRFRVNLHGTLSVKIQFSIPHHDRTVTNKLNKQIISRILKLQKIFKSNCFSITRLQREPLETWSRNWANAFCPRSSRSWRKASSRRFPRNVRAFASVCRRSWFRRRATWSSPSSTRSSRPSDAPCATTFRKSDR